ncbi:MAG: hypothetical protein LBI27_00170 [Clostridiales bacterium]|jgi:hypothetical protein|nr:hypothetical protein [Clostridiales bacterium]
MSSSQARLVEEGIEKIRIERAELDKLRASLERREAEIAMKEKDGDFVNSVERKEILVKEIDDLSAEIKRLRAERDSSVENFGGEISRLHELKTAENTSQIKQLQGEINFLLKGKNELEETTERLKEQIRETQEHAKHEQTRIIEEKEVFLSRTRAEREESLKKINKAHSVTMEDLERQKKEALDEIEDLQRTKKIEQDKLQSELFRIRTTQLAEIDAKREQFLAEIEKEKEDAANAHRAQERALRIEISEERREWEKEILKFQTEKQKILDEIKLLGYEYEKKKSDNLLAIEKMRSDMEKEIEAARAESLMKIEEDQAAAAVDFVKKMADQKSRQHAEFSAAEKELAEVESKKIAVLGEINALEVKFDRQRAENEVQLENIRAERLKEIDELSLEKLQKIEELRSERITALEAAYLEKSRHFENARNAKLDDCRKEIAAAEDELRKIKQTQLAAENEIEALRTEAMKIKEKNDALLKSAEIERKLKLEKMSNDKLAEVEQLCNTRLEIVQERINEIETKSKTNEEKLAADISDSTETLLELRRTITSQKLEAEKQRATQMEKIEHETIEAIETYTRLKLAKLSEIETHLEAYKNERLKAILNDIERHAKDKKKINELEMTVEENEKEKENDEE